MDSYNEKKHSQEVPVEEASDKAMPAEDPAAPVEPEMDAATNAAESANEESAQADETLLDSEEPKPDREPEVLIEDAGASEADGESGGQAVSQQEDEMLFNRRKIKNLEDENKRVSNELEALKQRTLRLSAEYENFRKRTLKEKEEIKSNCTAKLLKEILPVMDNLERALITETDDLPGLKEGVQITLDQFIQALKKTGVELIPTDQPFDPHLHEAVMHEQDPSKGEKEIAEVFLKGYKIGEKVIRHSVVKVVN